VGKSSVALGLALALRQHGAVGILDLDLYAPDIPAMLGITQRPWTHVWTVARTAFAPTAAPVEHDGLAVVSTGFLLGEDQPMGLEASTLDLLARYLVEGVAWPPLDFLVVDLPAGTSALQHVLARRLRVDGALLVLTPQRIAHVDTRKVVRLYRQLRIPVLGGVENMAFLRCPHCDAQTLLFPPVDHADSVWAMGIERLAQIPFAVGEPVAGERAELAALADHVAATLA
jgi:ATP-binding protein involved in chromosome partitioning